MRDDSFSVPIGFTIQHPFVRWRFVPILMEACMAMWHTMYDVFYRALTSEIVWSKIIMSENWSRSRTGHNRCCYHPGLRHTYWNVAMTSLPRCMVFWSGFLGILSSGCDAVITQVSLTLHLASYMHHSTWQFNFVKEILGGAQAPSAKLLPMNYRWLGPERKKWNCWIPI